MPIEIVTSTPLRIVAMNHLGFGLSDQASFEMVDTHHAASEFYRRIQTELPKRFGPGGQAIRAAGFFGAWDACGKPEAVAPWHAALPQMAGHTRCYPDNGHLIEEDRGPEIGEAILGLYD